MMMMMMMTSNRTRNCKPQSDDATAKKSNALKSSNNGMMGYRALPTSKVIISGG